MKKSILEIIAFFFAFCEVVNAQSHINQSQQINSDSTINRLGIKTLSDGYFMQNGNILVVKNGRMTKTDKTVTLENGTVILENGNYTKSGGVKLMFKEGEHMDMFGKMTEPVNFKSNVALDQNENNDLEFNRIQTDRQYNTDTTVTGSFNTTFQDGYFMQNGTLMFVKNGKLTKTDKEVILENGTVIMQNGSYMKNGGKVMMLKDGEQMDFFGNIIIPNGNKRNGALNQNENGDMNNNNQESYKLGSTDSSNNIKSSYYLPDGYTMQKGNIMQVKNGKLMRAEREITLPNGTVILTNGGYIEKDGTKLMFKEGEYMNMKGEMNTYTLIDLNESNKDYINGRASEFSDASKNTPTESLQNVPVSTELLSSDGFMLRNGNMVAVTNGKVKKIKKDIKLANGTVVMANGYYMKKGGKRIVFKEGDHMDLLGEMKPMY